MARELHEIVEEQVQRWRLAAGQNNHRRYEDLGQPHAVTVANAHGAGGADIARRVGKLLGIPVFDREIVEHIASSARVSTDTVETLDERARSRMDEYLSALFRERNFDHQDYLRALSQAVMSLWQHGPCVLVGHGAVHLVPRSHAVAVRLLAPEQARCARCARDEELTLAEARERVREVDAQRASFHRRCFDAAVDDPGRYDLVLDTAALTAEGCAHMIELSFRYKFEGRWRTKDDPAPNGAAA